ncbi:Inorganic phosphate transporter pho84 [Steccherinum ochraceum]|uniref:Inorganic phosphate transporter pho84 n=1 Tax=Steccherinum ochraceum TaxID=92696 RepID=A0A4R0R3C7_9APHY|nr:Inorganic phosphate transporter pho84 [Steccherinum ochraceum]
MASFMMSPYPGQGKAAPPPEVYGTAHSNGHEEPVMSEVPYGYETANGEYQPYTNPQAMGSYNWRSDDYQDQGALLNERRKAALDEVDKAFFSRFHWKVVGIVGAGFFTDAYDTFVIDTAVTILGWVYGHADSPGSAPVLSPAQILGLKAAGPIGTFFGMLVFGYLGDRLGRKRIYGMELLIIICSVFTQSLMAQGRAVNIVGTLTLSRFIMGVGIGGDYPTSSVIASEYAPVAARGRMITAVFATQGLGQVAGAIVSIVLAYAYKSTLDNTPVADAQIVANHLDQMWRILIGFGCIPGTLALLFRFTIPETPRFTMDIVRNVNQACQDVDTFLTTGGYKVDPDARVEVVQAPKASLEDWMNYFSKRKNLFVLLGTCYSWFALDIAFYGLSLNSSVFLTGIFPSKPSDTIWNRLHNLAVRNVIPICAGLIPGYIAAFFIIDKFGRRMLQLVGFAALFVLLLIMGVVVGTGKLFSHDGVNVNQNGSNAFLVLYCLASFFLNCGPNTTTFVVPAESFPTRYRSTMNGVVAASGKLGAIISQAVIYAQLKDVAQLQKHERGIMVILIVFAVFMLSGVASTLIVPDTMNQTLETNSNEEQANFIYGPAQPTRPEQADRYRDQ